MNALRRIGVRAVIESLREAIRDRLTAAATAHLDDRLRDDIGLRPQPRRAAPGASALATTAWR